MTDWTAVLRAALPAEIILDRDPCRAFSYVLTIPEGGWFEGNARCREGAIRALDSALHRLGTPVTREEAERRIDEAARSQP